MPELYIPPCEPLFIKKMVLNQGTGAVAVTSTYTNIEVFGPTKYHVQDVMVDVKNNHITFKLHLPSLRMTSNYNMSGKILLMAIAGTGNAEGNYSDISVVCNLLGEQVVRNGAKHFNVKEFDVKFTIGRVHVHLDNLFNGDKKLGNGMNNFLNENWQVVANEIKPLLEDKIGAIFKEFSNKIFQKFTQDQILPP